jgi:hypothetical protein
VDKPFNAGSIGGIQHILRTLNNDILGSTSTMDNEVYVLDGIGDLDFIQDIAGRNLNGEPTQTGRTRPASYSSFDIPCTLQEKGFHQPASDEPIRPGYKISCF